MCLCKYRFVGSCHETKLIRTHVTETCECACAYFVGMKKCTYDAIVSFIQRHFHDKECIKTLQNEFPRLPLTLISIT